jgi:hypothetical protein
VGEERRRGEGEAAPCDGASAPRPEAVHIRGEPYPSPREKLKPSVSGGEPKQRKEQGTAVNTYTVPPSTSGQRRLHLRPAVSVVAFLFSRTFPPSFHAYERTVEPLCVGSSSSPHGRPLNCATLVLASHAATPCRCAGRACT